MADRIGVMNHGRLILVEEKTALMSKLGKKQLTIHLQEPVDSIPSELADYQLELASEGTELIYTYDTQRQHTGITALLSTLGRAGIKLKDINTTQSSLEEIFVNLVRPGR